jgi:hypothetical protein
MQRALDVIDLVCQLLHIGPPPQPDDDGIVTFVQVGPEDLSEGLDAVALAGERKPSFTVPQPPS